ncbi:MAG TPA: hypothetical protein VGL91_00805 [Acidobacteriota bacterium]
MDEEFRMFPVSAVVRSFEHSPKPPMPFVHLRAERRPEGRLSLAVVHSEKQLNHLREYLALNPRRW